MKFVSLPSNIISVRNTHRHQPIGVVEAKRPGCLIQSSVAQLIRQQLFCRSAEWSYYLHFGLLIDGFNYVFAGVSQENVLFFQGKDCQFRFSETQFLSLADLGCRVTVHLL